MGRMGTVTIQKTSKGWKLSRLLAFLCVILGIVVMFAGEPAAGFVIMLGGIAWSTVTRMLTWWNHG
jgi:hypothetical protein